MPDGQILSFGPYRLDTQKEQFWHKTQPVRLTPKAFQLLCYVVERPGQLVTKEELFRVVWADTVVGDAALTMCVQEIRKALQDNPKSPQYMETVHRRGFRFIAAITTQPVASSQYSVVSSQQNEGQKAKAEETAQEIETEKPPPVDAGLLFQDSALRTQPLPSRAATGNGAQPADVALSVPEATAEALPPV